MKRKNKRVRNGLGMLNIVLATVLAGLLVIVGCTPEFATQLATEPATQPSETLPASAVTAPPTEVPTEPSTEAPQKKLIVIDAGHQAKGNYDKEPVGPGATELKAKVTSGTQGVATRLEEYRLNLLVAEKLQRILEARGYETVMIRTTHDVNISNAERAQIANELCADAFIRIHANGSEDPKATGMLTICQTKNNPYNGDLYDASYLLSEMVLDAMVEVTGAKRLYVWETDTMSGINWCQIPVTIVEMGFMSNEAEDRNMATDAYQELLALGIANGLDRYFEFFNNEG
jgi:N-acetylmuramoyl-L-alanine amidase